MPLTIKPLNSASAYRIIAISDTVEYGTLHIWLGAVSSVSDGDSPIVYESRGFIRTTNTLITGSNDCDNLQLNGDLYDFRYLENHKMITVDNDDGPYSVLALKAVNRDDYIPCHSLVSLDERKLLFFRYTTHSPAIPWMCIIKVLPGRQFAYVKIPMDGRQCTWDASWPVLLWDLKDAITCKLVRYASPSLKVPYALPLTEESVRNVLAPVFEELVTGSEQQFCAPFEYRGYYYESSSPLQASSTITDAYLNAQNKWLSALEEFTSEKVDFGELHYRALCKIDTVSVNGFAYAKDMKNILSDLKSLYSTLQGNVNPKNLADLFLSFKYGLRQTYADSAEYREAFKPSHISGVSATSNYDIADRHIECTSTIRFNTLDGAVEDVYNFLRRLDLLTSPENIWELIPFSFVVDWFLDINGKLKRLDQLDHVVHLDILAVFDSTIVTVDVPASRFISDVSGTINCRRFTRRCHDDASFPLIVPSNSSPISHWLEGTALIIQRLFK